MTDVQCACCGTTPAHGSVAMGCHPEITLCPSCLDWLNAKRDEQDKARGSVRLVSVDPIFPVEDVTRAVGHYEQLGFATEYHDETYAFALRDDLTIHLVHTEPGALRAGVVYLHVNDADQLAAEWRKAGMHIDGPSDTDHGKRESAHTDLDGNLIRFGSPLQR